MSTIVLACIVVIAASSESTSDTNSCFDCVGVRDLSKCLTTKQCDPYEICYAEHFRDANGDVYNMGCAPNSTCKNGIFSTIGTVDVIGRRYISSRSNQCAKCCQGNLCNKYLCTDDPRCRDMSPRDCSDPRALSSICKSPRTARFCLKSCNQCPVDGGFSDWSQWNTCTKSCGTGTQTRRRSCSNPTPLYGGSNCTGSTAESRTCNTNLCLHVVDGAFSEWSQWSSCSASCGGGTESRQRSCTNPKPENGGANCKGQTNEQRSCMTMPCPIDGGFSDWTAWSGCAMTCGSGTEFRFRTCDNPTPSNRGATCTGQNFQQKQCLKQPCPIDGKYSLWSDWSTCSASCGSGQQQRQRTCNNPPPLYGGANCSGSSSETQQCNTQPCAKGCADPLPTCQCRYLDDIIGICNMHDGTREHFCCYFCSRKEGTYICPNSACYIGELEENHIVNFGMMGNITCTSPK